MKKTLAVGLSLMLIVAAVFALSLSSSAAGTPATSVKVGSTTLNASNNTMTAGSGTVTFNATTGTLTLNNATGLGAITGANGDLSIVCTGTNTASVSSGFLLTNDNGGVTFGGTGSLSMTSGGFGIYVSGGTLKVTDSLRLTVQTNSNNYCFGTQNVNDIVFEKNCVVNLTGQGSRIIFHNKLASTNKVVVKDQAEVTVNAPQCPDFAVYCSNFEMLGGSMTLNVTGTSTTSKVQGIFIYGNDATVAKFSGGALTVNMSAANANCTDTPAFYLHHVKKADFCGTNLTLNVNTSKAGSFSAAFLTGWSQEISLSAGSITANLNDKTTGLIAPRYGADDFVLNITGGTLTGTAPSLLNTAIGGDSGALVTTSVAVNVKQGAKVCLLTPGGVFSSANKYNVVTTGSNADFFAGFGFDSTKGLVTANMAEEVYAVDVYDTAGVKTVLNKKNPSMKAGNGTIVFDPAAGTLTLTDATARKIYYTMGDLKIIAKGTNTLEGNVNFLANSDGGDLIFGGDGTLNIKTTGMGVYASAGDLIAEDDITLNVSGNNLVYCVKNSDATDGNMIFRENAKVTINAVGYQAILQNQKSPVNPDQKLIVEDNASVQVNIPNADSGASGTYTTAVLIRGMKMTGGSFELNLDGSPTAASRALGVQVQAENGAKGLVELLDGTFTVNHTSQSYSQSLAYSLYTYKSSGIVFGGADVTFNLHAAKGGDTSAVICPAQTPYLKISGGSVTVNANDKTMAFITPRLAGSGFLFEMTAGSLKGSVPSLLNTNNDSAGDLTVVFKEGVTVDLAAPQGVLSQHGEVGVSTSGTTATFAKGCRISSDSNYLLTADLLPAGGVDQIIVTDEKGVFVLSAGNRVYNGLGGQIRFDPMHALLILDGVKGPQKIDANGNLTVEVIGTNLISNSARQGFVVDGNLSLIGTGYLEISAASFPLAADKIIVDGPELQLITKSAGCVMADSLIVTGSSLVTAYAESGNALKIALMDVTGNAHVRIYSDNGTALKSDGTVTVADQARMTVDAVGTGILLEKSGKLSVRNSGKVDVYATAEGIMGGMDNTGASVEVTGGYVSVTGNAAIPYKSSSLALSAPYYKAGDSKASSGITKTLTGKEGYVLLSATKPNGPTLNHGNPGTADFVVFGGVMTVLLAAGGALLILRKRNREHS